MGVTAQWAGVLLWGDRNGRELEKGGARMV